VGIKEGGTDEGGAKGEKLKNLDSDGAVDVLFPVCEPYPTCTSENSIKIIYNVQQKVCQQIWDSGCRHSGDLCIPDPAFSLERFTSPDAGVSFSKI
jgi:hypothetical protein